MARQAWRAGAPLRAAVAAAGLAAALAACGGGAARTTRTASVQRAADPARAQAVTYRGPELQNPAPAPPLVGRDYRGGLVDLASDRGHAVLLTFVYTHCPDVCPLIISSLHNALAALGPNASKVRIVAVSTDPAGDTPKAVTEFLGRREMAGRMRYVIGSRAKLVPVWRAWGISVTHPTAHDEVNHSALVYGITASGRVTVVYPSNFKAADIAHDVPVLASH